jgi:hypothetical protein
LKIEVDFDFEKFDFLLILDFEILYLNMMEEFDIFDLEYSEKDYYCYYYLLYQNMVGIYFFLIHFGY